MDVLMIALLQCEAHIVNVFWLDIAIIYWIG